MPTITLSSEEIWLKGTGNASQVWSPTVSGLPAGAIINSVTLTFSSGNTYASPGRTEIFWGSEALAKNRLWYVSQSSGSGGTIDLTGRVKGNGSFSLLFRKTANSAGSQSNVYFTDIKVTIDYTNPISSFTLDKTSLSVGEKLTVTITRADSSYTHKVKYELGSESYEATGVGTSSSYTIPYAWVEQITNGVSLAGKVTVTTLNASGGTVGSVSKAVTVKWVNTKSDFTLGATSLKVGEKLSVTISRKVSSYTHTVKYALGTRSYTATGATTSSSYTIPLEWVDQITDGVSLNGKVTVETLKSDGTSLGTVSKDVTIKWVDTKSSFTLSSASLDAGSKLTVTITRQVSAYTHKVKYELGEKNYTATGVGTSSSYTIPTDWLGQIPNATSGTGKVTVTTLNASGGTVGSASANVTIKAGSGVVPSVGTIKAEVVGGLDGLYIQGYSKCKVTVSGHTAGTGATVASVLISGNKDSAWATTMTSSPLRTSGTVTFTVKVTDSRGRATSGTVSITVTAYKAVAITGRTALRCTSTGTVSRVTGKSAKLGVSYTMTSVGSNAATVKVYWRLYGVSSWTQISGWSSTSGYTAVALKDSLALDKRYEIRFDVADKISTASQTAVIEPGVVYMVWSKVKSSFGLGTYPTAEKQVAIAADWSLMLGSMDVGKSVRQRTRVRNLLDNSDFSKPVAQAGMNGAHGSTVYVVDRWIANACTAAQGQGCLTITTTKAYAHIWQKVTGVAGKTLTCAAKFSGAGVGAIRVYDESITTKYAEVKNISVVGCVAFTVPDDVDTITVLLYPNQESVSSGLIYWAALYEGSYTADTLPPYVPKGYAAELAECRLYYKVIDVNVAPWLLETTTLRRYYVGYEPMRTVPTADVSGLKEYGIWTDLGSVLNPYNIKNNRCLLSATSSETTSTRLYIGGSIALSADL